MIIFEILGTIAFSISGAIEAMKREMDLLWAQPGTMLFMKNALLGVLVLGLVTAVGGGILRDVLMGALPPAALRNPRNALTALFTALVAFVIGKVLSGQKKELHNKILNAALLLSDAVGLGAFTILGIRFVQE